MRKGLAIIFLLILSTYLISGCSNQEQKSYDQINVVSLDEQKAIFAAKPYVNRMDNIGFPLILKDITREGKNFSLYYEFTDGGQAIIEVEGGVAKYLTIANETDPIEESVAYMEKGAELLKKYQ